MTSDAVKQRKRLDPASVNNSNAQCTPFIKSASLPQGVVRHDYDDVPGF